jgi:enoyl-CoA hydratase/carnithine racemase
MTRRSAPSIRLLRRGPVVTVTVDRPEVRNALAPATIRELGEVVARLEDDEDLAAVIVTGAGDEAFISGGDLRALQKVEGAEAGRRMASPSVRGSGAGVR